MTKAKNFKDKINTKGFKDMPENINKTGANGRSVTKCLKDLLNGNYIFIEMILTRVDGTKKTLKIDVEVKEGINRALSVVLLRKALDGDLQAIREVLDRTEGKAVQQMDLTTQGDKITEIDYSKLSEATLKEIVNAKHSKD